MSWAGRLMPSLLVLVCRPSPPQAALRAAAAQLPGRWRPTRPHPPRRAAPPCTLHPAARRFDEAARLRDEFKALKQAQALSQASEVGGGDAPGQ